MVSVELDTGAVVIPSGERAPKDYPWVWALVLRGGTPVGDLSVRVESTHRWSEAVLRAAEQHYAHVATRERTPNPHYSPLTSVIIATRDRPAPLREAVASILAGDHEDLEVILVDNSPHGGERATIASMRQTDERITYVWEPSPGISRARNAGAARARGEVLAFTDDDVIVSERWLSSLIGALASHPLAACATGLIAPAELETSPQLWLAMASGLNKGYAGRVFDRNAADLPPLFPFRMGMYGSGANLAIRAAAFTALSGFDEVLGTGTPARGGEDLDLFLRLMLAGQQLVYEAGAVLFHHDHRRVDDALAQRSGYGTGLAAVLTKHMLTESAPTLLRLAPQGMLYLLSPRSPKNVDKRHGYPRIFDLAEMLGFARGPLAYWHSRANHLRMRNQ
ncbi:MAG TPA: glycosyltransferase [Solirubrobacteraceae bacterium]|nr:glycosyltransferase [Solirubrobacteraceae bacterium]